MAEDLPPLQFRHIIRPELDKRSELSEPAPKPPGPWSANLPMNQERAERMRAALAKHGDGETLRQFDNELKHAGYQPPPDETIAIDMKASGLHSTKSSDYVPELAASGLSEEAQGRVKSELNAMCAELGFQKGLGEALVEKLASVGPAVQRMTPNERENWKSQQTQLLVKLSGGADKVEEVRQNARAALARASGNFAKDLAASHLMNDAFLVLSLSHQQSYWNAFQNLRKRRR